MLSSLRVLRVWARPVLFRAGAGGQSPRNYSASSRCLMGFEEFTEAKPKAGEFLTTGRAWTVADLRRKSFDDLHKLWFVLYKERNLLLTEREKTRRGLRPMLKPDENRYIKVKKSMAGIKVVINERKRIQKELIIDAAAAAAAAAAPASAPANTNANANANSGAKA